MRHDRIRRSGFALFQVACIFFLFPLLAALPVPAAASPGPAARTEIWNLTYIHSHVSSTTDTAPQSSPGQTPNRDNINDLVDALNNAFGTSSSDGKPVSPLPVQRAGVGRLILHGTDKDLREMKRILILADAPWPQVQLDLWAVQVSGDDQQTAQEILCMENRIGKYRERMIDVQEKLERLAVLDEESIKNNLTLSSLGSAGVAMPQPPYSLNEALVLLTLSSDRDRKIGQLQDYVEKLPPVEATEGCGKSSGTPAISGKRPFRRLRQVFDTGTLVDDDKVLCDLATALVAFKSTSGPVEDTPKRLSRASTVTDRVLKKEVDAFAADMRELFLDPLLQELKDRRAPKASGIALVGRTRIVVTSGMEAGMAPLMASFVETTRPKPFGQDLLNTAFPATGAQAKSGDPGGTLTGEARIFAALAQPQALLLAAALSAPEKTFSEIAPGIGISVRPTVLPDASAARLTIDAHFGVTSTVSAQPNDVFVQGAPSGISRHDVRTDAAINAFDLFDISSFDVQSVSPQAPFFVPILGRLPIIGPAFQWPRHPKITHHSSLILVNAVILPRSLDLLRLYGDEPSSDESSKPKLPIACAEKKSSMAAKKAPAAPERSPEVTGGPGN